MDPRFLFKAVFRFSFGSIEIDCTKNFAEIFSAEQSNYATEEGSPVSRGRFLNPVEVSFEGRISATPFGPLGSLLSGGSRLGKDKEKLDDLIKLFLNTETFAVGSGFHVFDGFQFTRLEASKNTAGFWLEFKATIKQMPSVKLEGSSPYINLDQLSVDDAKTMATLLLAGVAYYGTTSPYDFKDGLGILA